jgi:hypothetical protein
MAWHDRQIKGCPALASSEDMPPTSSLVVVMAYLEGRGTMDLNLNHETHHTSKPPFIVVEMSLLPWSATVLASSISGYQAAVIYDPNREPEFSFGFPCAGLGSSDAEGRSGDISSRASM